LPGASGAPAAKAWPAKKAVPKAMVKIFRMKEGPTDKTSPKLDPEN
jgi:hypothetical protein